MTVRTSSPRDYNLSYLELTRFAQLRWLGTVGALLTWLGGLGAGALPVVGNAYPGLPLGSLMGRMLQTSSIVTLLGVGLIVTAWVLMAPFVGASSDTVARNTGLLTVSMLRRTFLQWTVPLIFTAPLFTQDIYSYLAQGAAVARGLDPYSAGPVELLGADDPLARSVPFIWANSPSPYGPVALGIARLITAATGNNIFFGILAHRLVTVAAIAAAAWAVTKLARRAGVRVQVAIWLGILNPLVIFHLVGGIHNEALMLGLVMVGLEMGLRAIGHLTHTVANWRGWLLLVLAGFLIACAGMVKVTGFVALGFVGMAIARHLRLQGFPHVVALSGSVAGGVGILVSSVALVTAVTGIPLGWITGQGGAATIMSWMSVTTDIGVVFGRLGMILGLGDHTVAMLVVTRGVGVGVGMVIMVITMVAVYRGTLPPVGGLGVFLLILVTLFPVVHPWYMLWAIMPLSTYPAATNQQDFFRKAAVIYSALLSFSVLPRGLTLPSGTVIAIYVGFVLSYVVVMAVIMWSRRRFFGASL
ncbi:MAG: polyprenol phosphomannose-dependent alpha 1,6 mannosyltransferase MptB [Corynebacterium sp.]|nr:polyprenol phosphomannose-dependent alpha 1,6 mannosyltransferase MptB [Corynebacterium sp.]